MWHENGLADATRDSEEKLTQFRQLAYLRRKGAIQEVATQSKTVCREQDPAERKVSQDQIDKKCSWSRYPFHLTQFRQESDFSGNHTCQIIASKTQVV